ncbi:MAG TPA: AAA family ATPase, partial [Phototrophicaceae bacterium]|nr:AAA family ATPase [Phototrophicaceae bacterium]
MVAAKATSQLIGSRYQEVRQLGRGGMGAVYSVVDRLSGLIVAMKRVLLPMTRLDFASQGSGDHPMVAITNEFRILASLRHPNIISVLDYGFDDQPFFTMDLITDPRTITEACIGQPLETRIDYAIQMLQALVYLHRRNIIHRDLKPANVLVNASGMVKVLDFGLALSREYIKQDPEAVGGTLAYIAPELLQGSSVSVQSDLYAVGLILYEMLNESYPFRRDASLIVDILKAVPDVSMMDPALGAVVARLLDKVPANRYASAEEVIIALSTATGFPVPEETLAIRESFIEAARFVGREPEIARLKELVRETLAGKRATWLLGGESGSGKSRLLSEMRIEAMVDKILVLSGQAVSEGASPYHIWRNVIRRLALLVELTDFEAGVLRRIVPDIERLLDRPIPEVPPLTPDAERDRIFAIAEKLFQNYGQPLLVILEDLHWANDESLDLLKHLYRTVSEAPLLIVGSYRDDEVPDLPQQVSHDGLMSLKLLDKENITRLSESMLGQYGTEPHIIDYLKDTTEGNVFFLVEVVRVLAEQAGKLSDIAKMPLPEKMVASGMMQILQHRLERVPEEGRQLLQIAAVIGRDLDETLLKHINSEVDYEQWLTICNNIAVLNVENNRWRFAHDKLRETLVESLPKDTRRTLHHQAAVAIEEVYPDAPDWVAALAYQWEQADDAAKASVYLENAARIALEGAAYNQAHDFIKRSEAFDGRLGQLDEFRLMMRNRIKGGAIFHAGKMEESLPHYSKALRHMGLWEIANQDWKVGLAVGNQLIRQILHRRLPRVFIGHKDPQERILSLIHVAGDMSSVYYVKQDILRTLYLSLVIVNTAEIHKPHNELSLPGAYSTMAMLTGLIPLPKIASFYHGRTIENIEHSSDHGQAGAWVILGIYDTGVGKLKQADREISNAQEIYQSMGNQRRWEESTFFLGMVRYHEGQFKEAVRLLQETLRSGVRRQDFMVQFLDSMALTEVVLRLHQLD